MEQHNVDYKNAVMELAKRLAKTEYIAKKGKKYTYIPNGTETAEIMVEAAIIYNDVVARNTLTTKGNE
jgi:hypothetical protein